METAQQTAPPTAPKDATYERYRVYQKNLYKECMDDARMMVRRAHTPEGTSHADTAALSLALFSKRCEAWSEYRERAGFTRASDM